MVWAVLEEGGAGFWEIMVKVLTWGSGCDIMRVEERWPRPLF